MKNGAAGIRGKMFRWAAIGLCLLSLVPMTGCATLIFPERSLVGPSQRGGVDGILLTVDILASIPLAALGCLLIFAANPISSGKCDNFWEMFYFPVALDLKHGTLFLPKEGAASSPRR